MSTSETRNSRVTVMSFTGRTVTSIPLSMCTYTVQPDCHAVLISTGCVINNTVAPLQTISTTVYNTRNGVQNELVYTDVSGIETEGVLNAYYTLYVLPGDILDIALYTTGPDAADREVTYGQAIFYRL